jgi:predicted nucleic acid-binding protein
MAALVADASAIAAILFDELEAASIVKRLQGAVLYAPSLLPYELAHTFVKKVRKDTSRSQLLWECLSEFEAMKVQLVDMDLPAVANMSRASGLSGYDASYLLLARNLNVDLVTLDRRLATAAKRS